MRAFIQRQYWQWLNRRIPQTNRLELNQRRLFIFPSLQGAYFVIVIFLILVAAINYQNNLAYAVVFFLFSLLNTAICFTYLNLSGLELKAGRSKPVFVGDYAEFEVLLKAKNKKSHQRVFLQFPNEQVQEVDLLCNEEKKRALHYKVKDRGIIKAPRLLLQSYYPLGLIRCWSWLDLQLEVLVYPKPLKLDPLPGFADADQGQQSILTQRKGAEDFAGFKSYEAGDPVRDVNWKAYAKGQDLLSKVYQSYVEQTHWVDDEPLRHLAIEERLSKMCYWALELAKSNKPFGLKLANTRIEPDVGEKHLHHVLKQLALFGKAHD